MISTELKSLFAKVRVLGQSGDRVSLSSGEIAWLLYLAAKDLGLPLNHAALKTIKKDVPSFFDIQIPTNLLGTWLMWRKWIFDVDNRSGQETGYLFEPVLASCMGGVTIGSRNSPIKRVNDSGHQTADGRQIDCLDANSKIAYEFKLRVTIAASGQGRFAEELSFPVECQAAGLKPVLIVLDPTPSARLAELREAFESNGGEVHADDAWEFIEKKAGKCMSAFIENYLRPILLQMAAFDDKLPDTLSLSWGEDNITFRAGKEKFVIRRNTSGKGCE
jgi:hypothetical protein